jgi:hypothetical protein
MKRSISSAQELNAAIEMLEQKAALQKQELKEQFAGVVDNLRPVNLIRHGVQSVFSGGNRQDLIKAAIGIGSGLLGRKLMSGGIRGRLMRRILGMALEFGAVGYVLKNTGKLKAKGADLIGRLFRSRSGSDPGKALVPDPEQPAVNYSSKN